MRKRMLTIILAGLLFLLTACGTVQEKKPEVGPEESAARFKIMELRESGFLGIMVQTEREDLYSVSLGDAVCYDEDGAVMDRSGLRPGMVVDIYWNGMVLESWPGQIMGVTALQVVEQQDDLVGLYRQVLNDLWENDSALNHDAVTLGLDFSTLTNLTESELRALEYLVSCDFGLAFQTVTGTWAELCDAGYIDRDNLYWEDGVFLSIELKREENGRITFNAHKWRSGTGAIWFNDCTAVRGRDGSWSYDTGSFAIS